LSSAIALKNIYKSYFLGERELPILKNINLDIQEGDFVAFMGPSGSGKSTLLHLMGALDRPTRGDIEIGGENIAQFDDQALAHLRNRTIGFIFQNFFLLNYYSALENVHLPLIYSDIEDPHREKAMDMLDQVGLKNRAEHRPNQLSGGERQRVAIARALVNDPAIIFADEPTGNLDSKNGELVLNFLKDINGKGKTIILITHDEAIAHQAHRILHIYDGEIT